LLQLVLLSCELTGARYGALGVLNPDGASLKDFVYVGIPEETARKIGQLPRGKGLLGAVIHERATIRVAEAGGGATLSVHDEGPGISPEDLPRLFDRYFQTERARAKRQGLGLGLFITKGLVEAHGGTITVESEPGAGSTFRVWLPAAQRKA
jgi:signal transduction histidine kinase